MKNRYYQQCGAACLLLKIFKEFVLLTYLLNIGDVYSIIFNFSYAWLCCIITFVSMQIDSLHKFNIPSYEAIDHDFHTMQVSLAMFLPGILLNMSIACSCDLSWIDDRQWIECVCYIAIYLLHDALITCYAVILWKAINSGTSEGLNSFL